MRYSFVATGAALIASVMATGEGYTTEVVTAYTTYCPEATTLTHNSKTYVITTPQYVTLPPSSAPASSVTPASTYKVTPASSSAAVVTQISDHQPQAPTSAPAAVSSSAAVVTQISDHQPQAPTSAPPAVYSSAAAASSSISTLVVVPSSYAAPASSAAAYTTAAAVSPASTPASTPAYKGAANKAFAASGASLAAVFGFVAYIL